MDKIYFHCPGCQKRLHIKNKDNLFPVDYKIRCRYCNCVFAFVSQIIKKGKEITIDDQIIDFLEEDEDDNPFSLNPF